MKRKASQPAKRRLRRETRVGRKSRLKRQLAYADFSFQLFRPQMADCVNLRDALMVELSDVNLFCKLIKFPSIRDKMLKVFKVSFY